MAFEFKGVDLKNNQSWIAATKRCEERNKELARQRKHFDFTNMPCWDLKGKKHYCSILNKKWMQETLAI